MKVRYVSCQNFRCDWQIFVDHFVIFVKFYWLINWLSEQEKEMLGIQLGTITMSPVIMGNTVSWQSLMSKTL